MTEKQEEVLGLLRREDRWMMCWEIARELGYGAPVVSAALRELRVALLVTCRKVRWCDTDMREWRFG